MLAPSSIASAEQVSNSFDEARSPDGTCELRLNIGGPYEVTIDGGPITIYPNGSVVAVPQGSSVHYLRQERTIGSTAIGENATCATFVPVSEPATDSDESGIGRPVIAGAGFAIVAALGAAWWFLIGAKRRNVL